MTIRNFARLLMNMLVAISLCTFALSCGGGGDGDSGSTPGESGTITLSASETSIPADNSSSCIITATILDGSGNPVRHYTDVTFTTTLGRFRNGSTTYKVQTQPPLGSDGFPNPDASPTGVVEVQFIAGNTSGSAKITASSNGVTQTIYIALTHTGNTGVPVGEAFSLSAEYLNVSGWWVSSLADLITASVGDASGTAVKDGTIIDFKTYNTGGFFEMDQAATESGRALSTLYSAASPAPTEGFLMATGETTGGSTTRVTSIAAVPYPDQHIMYAGTNGGGVYKSTDYGTTWETVSRSSENPKRGQNLIEPYIKGHSGIAIDPDNHNNVYVGTGYLGKGNVYRSLDGGNNWNSNNTEEWNGIYDTTAAVLAVVADGDDLASTDYPYVWIGTEGKGALYATDGKTFQPSGSYASTPVLIGTGNGTMSEPVVSYTSVSEEWTATYVQTDGNATTPTFSGTGDGSISAISTSATTKTETWNVQYETKITVGTVTQGAGNVGDGNVVSVKQTEPNAASETWTLTAIDGSTLIGPVSWDGVSKAVTGSAIAEGAVIGISVAGPAPKEVFTLTCITSAGATDPATFSVVSDIRGSFGIATAGTAFTSQGVSLTITEGNYAADEIFQFTATKGTVTGIAVTGPTAAEAFTLTCTKAATGADDGEFEVRSDTRGLFGTVTADGNSHTLTIPSGDITLTVSTCATAAADLYQVGEAFTFTSTIASGTVFSVESDVAGFYPNAAVGTDYATDGLSFLIQEGTVPFAVGDTFTFTTTTTEGWRVIGSVSGAQTDAATDITYTSDGGEVGFTIYAGTTPFATGDKFSFSTTAGISYWTVVGSESGTQTNLAFNGSGYYSDKREVYFIITQGSTPFADGDTFTFTVTASTVGHGWTVSDIVQVPDTHGSKAVLYIGTATGVYKSIDGGRTWSSTSLFTGDFVVALALYPTATGGNSDIIYAGTLNAGVWMSTDSGASWTQYTSGMDGGKGTKIKDILLDPSANMLYALAAEGSGDSATGDVYVHDLIADGTMAATTWRKANTGLNSSALYALAADIPSWPTALYAGGEGINLYEATSGLDMGNPSWISSKTGLSNLLMARMPILFSGQCTLNVSQYRNNDTVNFIVYIQDVNGNPPIAGTNFTATYMPEAGTEVVVYDITYGDVYTYRGTFSDPSDPTTNLPYSFSVTVSAGDQVVIVYTPGDTLPDAPGSSGSPVTNTYTY